MRACAPDGRATSFSSAMADPPAAAISAATVDATPASAPTSLHGPAEVVDDDAGAPAGQQERVGATDAASRAGDDRDASLEAVHVHADPPSGAAGSSGAV